MENLCTRCVRLRLAPNVTSTTSRAAYQSIRSFTASSSAKADDDSLPIANSKGIKEAGSSSGSSKPPGLLIRRVGQDGKPVPRSNSGPILRRSDSANNNSYGPPRPLQRTRSPSGSNENGAPRQFLRRADGQNRNTRNNNDGTRTAGQAQAQANRSKLRQPRRSRRSDDDEDGAANAQLEASMDDYITKYIDRPDNATTYLPYNPQPLSLSDLKQDWPNTPLSTSGLSESVTQTLSGLSSRLAHGYMSPNHLAEHFLKGKLTRFESAAEKELVLERAAQMVQDQTSKTDLELSPLKKPSPDALKLADTHEFVALAHKADEKKFLVDESVRGVYSAVEKQRYPFLDNVVKNLRNNSTYGEVQSKRVLERIAKLLPQGGQAKKAAAKAA